ncbi:5'-AMP-activated protein kinase beta subunit, interation domain-containing protein [Cristinia sonorae]|uniref:5'-AMP-activated protein kinase beta subunit, interation domain-containing protein n=1 Tax=Cristinia sonorae TaxID=1940300 RepID=A0A8K0UUQ9_9AGAR|nr:5'-AMP-activated protein kinase beta subunit, interation domain-containing protein [Cristinia sonorae]
MGNSTSNANNSSANFPPDKPEKRHDSPVRRTASPSRGGSPSPSSNRVHRSLRSKKKSLELPDLASLALTPASSSPSSSSPHNAYRRPRASSPIPIPISANVPVQTFRVQNALPSAAHIHVSPQGRGGRHKSFLSSAYPSTHSFVSGDRASPPRQEITKPEFVQEVIHSALPLAIPKAEEDDRRQEPVPVVIKWRGGGRSVVLARAGDDNWKGRQPMDYDLATNTWSIPVLLLPGTHHFKFIVDDQWRIADDYPRAVDDLDGSLANYVNVLIPASSSSPQTPGHVSPLSSPHHSHPNQFHSFWSDTSGGDTAGDTRVASGTGITHYKAEAEWTSVIPPELIQAAAEEENYLANADSPTTSSSVPAPNIPPAPGLPRHLDKLIVNVRPAAVTGSPAGSVVNGGGVDKERDRSRRSATTRNHRRTDKESRGGGRSNLGMTATAAGDLADGEPSSPIPVLPVVTASGTDVTAALSNPQTPHEDGGSGVVKKFPTVKLDGPGLSDDASVLPVPNHVVLHHLMTSAIRNGVLAVANTTRYRKKQYITTILYKPT